MIAEMALRVFWILIMALIIPIANGIVIEKIDVLKKYSLKEKIVYGFVVQLLWSELIGIFCVFFQVSFELFSKMYLIFSCIVVLFAIAIFIREKIHHLKNIRWKWNVSFLKIIIYILICFQIGWLITHSTEAIVDGTIEQMVTTIETGTLHEIDHYTGMYYEEQQDIKYVGFYPELLSIWANLMKMSPNIFCNIILPIIFIPYTYLVYEIWIKKIFNKDRKLQELTMLFFICLNWYGCYSVYTSSSFMLLYPWSINNVLINIIIPLYLYNLLELKLDEKIRLGILFGITSIAVLALGQNIIYAIGLITIVWCIVLICRRYVRIERDS